jgi:riboflavin synthase alpha subunit
MFTGIIQAVGQVAALERRGGDVRHWPTVSSARASPSAACA